MVGISRRAADQTNLAMGNLLGRTTSGSVAKVLLVGPSGSGKTTLLHRLKKGIILEDPQPTPGFNVETIQHSYRGGAMSFTFWDAADNYAKMRETWPAGLYPNAEGVIFMVDATAVSPGRNDEPNELLRFLMADERIKGLPLLIMANKCDLLPSKDGQAAYEQAANLVWNLLDSDILLQGLAREGKGPREKVGSSVTQYVGVVEGLTWLATAIERSRKASRPGSR